MFIGSGGRFVGAGGPAAWRRATSCGSRADAPPAGMTSPATSAAAVPSAVPSLLQNMPDETPSSQLPNAFVAAAVLCGRGGVGLELLVLRGLLLVRPGAAPLPPGRQPRRPALDSPHRGDAGRVQSGDGIFPAPDRRRGDRAGAVAPGVLPRPPGAGVMDVRSTLLGNRAGERHHGGGGGRTARPLPAPPRDV